MRKVLFFILSCLGISVLCAAAPAVSNNFEKSSEGWNTPRYWNGKLVRKDGRMHLEPTAKNGQTFGRCTKMLLNLRYLSGAQLELAFSGSGKGVVTVGAMVFPDAPGKPYLVEHGKITLTGTEKNYKVKLDYSKIQTDRVSLTFEIPAGAAFTFDNIKITKSVDKALRIQAPEVPVMRGKAADIRVKTNAPGKDFSVFTGNKYFAVKADARGVVTIPAGKILLNRADNSCNIIVARNGKSVRFQTSVAAEQAFDKALAAARKIGKSPVQILWIGDSELDFDRSRNTPAQVDYYLNRAKKSASYFNCAVAGDSLLRVNARLAGRYAPRPDAYRALKKADPDLIIVMLGHNDTMTRSNDNFATSQVPVGKQVGLTLDMLRSLRTRYPEARVLLVSPLALDGAFLKGKIAKRLARGAKNLYWFGSPEMMKKFTANWKKAAAEAGVEFLDIYTPMSKISDRIKFFKKGDEVHLNAAGHVWLTDRILDYLAKNVSWNKVKKYSASSSFVFKAAELAPGKLNRGSGTLAVAGKRVIKNGALAMDGKTTALALSGVAATDIKKGFTVDLACMFGKPAGNSKVDLAYDGLFFAPGSFVLARYQRSFYLLWFDGKKYQRGFMTPAFFDLNKPRPRHIAMTCKYHEAVDQGEIWTEIQIFLDGKAVVSQKLPKAKMSPPAGNFEFAGSSRFGTPWNLGGTVYGGGFFNRILTEKEIRDRVLEFRNVVKPAFQTAAYVPAGVLKKIASSNLSAAQKSACLNLAKSGFKYMDKLLLKPQAYLLSFGKKKVLTLLNYPGAVRVVSLYDTRNKRELFNWNNPLFELHFQRGNAKKTLAMADLTNAFSSKPAARKGVTSFVISHSRKSFPAVSGKSFWKFDGKRLEYTLEAKSLSYATYLGKVTLPSIVIAPLDEKNTNLVVPEAGGLLYKNAVAQKVTYKGVYPRMLTSMQFGAVYDKKGGVYFSPGDPHARMMEYSFRIDSDGLEVKIDRPAARRSNKDNNSFSSLPGAAVIESFEGDWYDSGMLYRQELDRLNAVWWRKKLPNTDTPQWFRDNALKLLVFHTPDPRKVIKLRDYLGQGFVIQHWYWWERGAGHHLCPIPRANTEYIAHSKLLKPYGVRVISYTNGRLWSTRDQRGKATLYNTSGKDAAVKKADGSVYLEPYGVPCAVLCPSSPIYQKAMYDMMTRLVSQGISGCFVDQLGAARPILCQAPGHGHQINDPASWNINGHRKAFIPVREYWRKNNIDAITVTEDNSEHCVGLMDGLGPWRWMHDHQIPLHVLVYSGRTQYTSRDPVGSDQRSPFVKAAVQTVQSEQMGTYGIIEITSPARGLFRRYLKRLMHLRYSALDFFNCGTMLRPPRLEGLGKKIYTRWGNHGTKDVGTLPVITAAWEFNGSQIILLINSTDKRRSGRIASEPANRRGVWNSGKTNAQGSRFSIEPYGCELRLYGKKPSAELLQRINRSFAVIRKTFTEKDPFGVDKMKFPDTPAFDARKWQQSAASPIVLGARVNKDIMVLDNVFYGVFFAGTGNFGTASKGFFEVELSAPSYSGGGNIQIMSGHPDSGTLVGKMILDRKNVVTDSWSDYRKYRIPALMPLGGKHKIFFKLNGGSVCNFRNWRWVPGGEK